MISQDDIDAMGETVEDAFNPNPRMFDMLTTLKLWRSGMVRRWHSNDLWQLRESHDYNSGHCSRVAILYLGLFWHARTTADMVEDHFTNVVAALLHDMPEVVSGDIPSPGKRRVFELKVGDMVAAEHYWIETDGGYNWSAKTPQVDLCDLLDAIMFAKSRAPDVVDNRDDWMADKVTCLRMAEGLGVAVEVDWLLKNV